MVQTFDLSAELFHDFCDDAGADGSPAFADGKAQLLLHGDRRDQFDLDGDIVARHHHLGARRQLHDPRHIRGAEVELRPVVAEDRKSTRLNSSHANISYAVFCWKKKKEGM